MESFIDALNQRNLGFLIRMYLKNIYGCLNRAV